jgi:hypothetical protein
MNATTFIHSVLSQQDYDVGPRMMWASYGMALDGYDGHLLGCLDHRSHFSGPLSSPFNNWSRPGACQNLKE